MKKRFEHSLGLRNIIWGLRIDQGGRAELRLKMLQNVRAELGIIHVTTPKIQGIFPGVGVFYGVTRDLLV